MKIIRHFNTINKHRWEVFKLSCRVGIPLRGLVHDLSKYSFTEFFECAKYYTDGTYSPINNCKKINGYSKAWLHHKGRNKHHFEYWYDWTTTDQTPIIPFKYMLEMVCDRIAASITYYGKNYTNDKAYEYFMNGKDHYVLNSKLKNFLEEVFKNLKDEGTSSLNKKRIKKIYDKCIK